MSGCLGPRSRGRSEPPAHDKTFIFVARMSSVSKFGSSAYRSTSTCRLFFIAALTAVVRDLAVLQNV